MRVRAAGGSAITSLRLAIVRVVDAVGPIWHHDSKHPSIMMHMRTTVTLDPDVESMLRREVRRRGLPFKQVLNNAIRAGLRNMRRPAEAFEPLVFDMGMPRVDLTKAAALAADLEDQELIGRYRRRR
jgi:hypothetical protein